MPDPGVPVIRRWHVAWMILAVAWAVVSLVGRGAIDYFELAGTPRYLVLAAAIPFYWYSAQRILAWGRREPGRAA